jgi:hypothetical protein
MYRVGQKKSFESSIFDPRWTHQAIRPPEVEKSNFQNLPQTHVKIPKIAPTREYFFKIPGYSIIFSYAEQLSKKFFEKKLVPKNLIQL